MKNLFNTIGGFLTGPVAGAVLASAPVLAIAAVDVALGRPGMYGLTEVASCFAAAGGAGGLLYSLSSLGGGHSGSMRAATLGYAMETFRR